jgi:hypothetical protein
MVEVTPMTQPKVLSQEYTGGHVLTVVQNCYGSVHYLISVETSLGHKLLHQLYDEDEARAKFDDLTRHKP